MHVERLHVGHGLDSKNGRLSRLPQHGLLLEVSHLLLFDLLLEVACMVQLVRLLRDCITACGLGHLGLQNLLLLNQLIVLDRLQLLLELLLVLTVEQPGEVDLADAVAAGLLRHYLLIPAMNGGNIYLTLARPARLDCFTAPWRHRFLTIRGQDPRVDQRVQILVHLLPIGAPAVLALLKFDQLAHAYDILCQEVLADERGPELPSQVLEERLRLASSRRPATWRVNLGLGRINLESEFFAMDHRFVIVGEFSVTTRIPIR